MLIKIFKKLKNKNVKDILLRLRKIFFATIVRRRGTDFYYSNSYLLKNLIEKDIQTFQINFKIKSNDFINSENEINHSNTSVLIRDAELIMNHQFNLLGSDLVSLDYGTNYRGLNGVHFPPKKNIRGIHADLPKCYKTINWCVDYKSGYQWDINTFYTNVRTQSDLIGVDIKLPWELSRCQHFGILITAYSINNDERYGHEVKNQIIDWIHNNPFCHGPNWVCAMDVGIRVSNWLLAIEYFKGKDIFDDRTITLIAKSIIHHIKYLENNLEWTSKLTSNHYLSDIAGMYFLSQYFKSYKKNKRLEKFSIDELNKEIFKQTYSDGVNSEGSTSYHRLVLEIFAYCGLLDKKTSKKLSKGYFKRLMKLFNFSNSIMDRSGFAPQIGDNDSGIFIKFKNRKILDYSYLNIIERALFKDCDNNLNGIDCEEPEHAILGVEWNGKKYYSNKYNQCVSFDEAGIYIYKRGDIYILISNGPNGQNGNGGHAHNDKLSFIIKYKEEEIFIDPGTFLYTPFPEERNKFRSTKSHNTVCVNDEEQNRFVENYLFGTIEDCKERTNKIITNENGFTFVGSHDSYKRINKNLVHQREIKFDYKKLRFEIKDLFKDKKVKKEATLIIPSKKIRNREGNTFNLDVGKITFETNKEIDVIKKIGISQEYGVVQKTCTKILVRFENILNFSIDLDTSE